MTQDSLSRRLGLLGLIATGVCSMIGASINVMPFMIQRNVPGIGPYVLPAFMLAALPALLAALAYLLLATALPRAGGSYVYVSRGLHAYWGFVASFSQWFGLSIVIGVVAYVIVPFLRDVALALEWVNLAKSLNAGGVRVALALALLWLFVGINIRGAQSYERTIIPLMLLMFLLGGVVIVAGFSFTQEDFWAALLQKEGRRLEANPASFQLLTFLSAASLMFASFIGFESIAQAGGEAKNPERNLPLAIALTILIVGAYYLLFTSAVYHAVPWSFVAAEAHHKDITAPGLLSYLLPAGLTVAVVGGAAVALTNDLPAMILSVSRLLFAWAEDGIFPKGITRLHPRYQTPYVAILISGLLATVGILGSHFAGDFFLGIDIMVTAMLVNFLLICLTLANIDRVNPAVAADIKIIRRPWQRQVLGWTGSVVLAFFLLIHTYKDLSSAVDAWYFHSTYVWGLVMLGASLYWAYVKRHKVT
jgi:APA family basic amino acid/polyamine antiporter